MKYTLTRYIAGIRYENEQGEKKTCSGAIIGSHIVLTAAQCIPKDSSQITVTFGDSLRPDRVVAELAVANVRVHADYTEFRRLHEQEGLKERRHDLYNIAVVKTKEPLPAASRHLQLAASTFPVSQIPSVYVVGYGAIGVGKDGKAVGQGQLHSAITPRGKDSEDDRVLVLDQSKGTGICTGDEGGPAVVENADGLIVMGIASTFSNAADEKDKCGGISTFIDVHTFREWIIMHSFEMMQKTR